MGRRPNEPKQTRNGTYTCWNPSVKKYVNLGTTNRDEAIRRQQGFYSQPLRHGAPTFVVDRASEMGEPNVASAIAGDEDIASPQRSTAMLDLDEPLDSDTVLKSWAGVKTDAPSTNSTQAAPLTGQPKTYPPVPGLSPNPILSSKPIQSKIKPGLSPEQNAVLASGLKKTVANLNVVIVGAAVDMFGRVPCALDDEEVKMLELGWELYIDEMFAKAKMKPIHLIIMGNLMIAASMYAGGTPKPKKPATPPKLESVPTTPGQKA